MTVGFLRDGRLRSQLERIYASAETTNDVQLQVDDGRITEFRALLGIEGEVQFGEETCVDTAIFTFSSNPSTASYTATTATVDTTFASDATSSCGDVEQQPTETKPVVLTFTGSTVTGEFGPLEDGGATASFAFTIARS